MVRDVVSRTLDAVESSRKVSLFKAPQPGKAQRQLIDGYHAEDFPDKDGDGGRAYFAKEKDLADLYNNGSYGAGVIEVQISSDVYEGRLARHESPYQGGPLNELAIPHEDFDVLNSARRILHDK
jgi:hypothetical protein